jgi:tellurite methyltransferase
VLVEFQHLLPTRGVALDLAAGLGGNALLLAGHGLEAHAWDISPVAMERLRGFAAKRGLAVATEVRDAVREPPEAGRFDVIVVNRFLERSLAPALIAALRPGGLLYYQTFSRARVDDTGPKNPAYRLDDNELISLFRPLTLRAYREEGLLGDLERGLRNEAWLVGQRPP